MAQIENDASNRFVTGTSYNDSIRNGGDRVTIDGGDGDDTISHYGTGDNISISGGAGNDSILSFGDKSIIDGGVGNDSIKNFGSNVTLEGGVGNDFIYNYDGDRVTIKGGDGDDTVLNEGDGQYGKIASISGGNGNDLIVNDSCDSVTIDGGAGDDAIGSSGKQITIIGGVGNDTIEVRSTNTQMLIQYSAGDGNDIIYKFKADSTLKIGDGTGTYYKETVDSDIIVTVGDGKITLKGAASLSSVNIAGTYKEPSRFTENNDTYDNTVNNVTLDALGGKDTITNSGENVSINGGAGDDLINNNAAQNVTINTAQGNDTIKLGSEVKSFKVENFSSGDVISLATAVDSLETVSGGIKAGNVTISGITSVAKTTSSWQTSSNFISRVSSTSAGAKVSSKKITYDTTSGSSTLFTITGLKSTVGVSLSGKTVTLTEAALANRTSDTISISDGYTLALATGVDTIKEALAGGWTTLSSGNVAYLKGGTGSYYSLSGGNKITYNASVAGGDNMVELRGVKGTPSVSNKRVSLAANNFASDVSVVSNAGDYRFWLDIKGKKFTGGEGNDGVSNWGDSVTINTGAGNDSVENDGSSVTINTGDGNDSVENVGDSVTISGGKGNDSIYNNCYRKSDGSIHYYTDSLGYGKNVLFKYSSGDGNDIIYGFKESSTLSISGGEFSSVISGDNIVVTVGDGNITLQGAANLETVNIVGTVKKFFTLTEGNDTFCSTLDDATIQALGGNDSIYNCGGERVSISGGNGDDTIYSIYAPRQSGSPLLPDPVLDDDYVSSSSSSSSSTDTVSDEDYSPDKATLLGGAGKDVIYNVGANVLIEGGTANDAISLSSDAKNNLIKYSSGDGNDTIWGFRADSTLQIGDGTGTYALTKNSGEDNIIVTVGENTITLVDAAKLSKVNIKGTKKEERLMETVKTANTVISGTANDDAVENQAKNVTIYGGDGNDNLTTIRKYSSVKLYGEAGDDTLTSGNGASNLLDGGVGNDDIYTSGKQNTLLGGDGNDNIENDGGSKVSIDGGKGNDKIYNSGKNVTIIGGADNDSITLEEEASNTLIKYALGDGNDLITGFKSTDTLSIANGKGTYSTIDGGSDVILKVGDDRITIKGAASWLKFTDDKSPANIAGELAGKILTVTSKSVTLGSGYEIADASKRTAATKITGNELDNSIVGGSGKDTLYGADGDDTLYGGKNKDKLYGQDGDDYLSGGSGDDYLNGGEGEDTLWGGTGTDTLIGGADDDVFIYSGGKDVITDYVSGQDAISLGAAYSKASIEGNDVVLTIDTGTLTIKNAKYQEIKFLDGEDYYTKRFGVEEFDNDSPKNVTISARIEFGDATKRTKDFKATGNELNNTILGGSGKDTLYGEEGTDSLLGGKGNDYLSGGDGEDTLWGGAGNDTLEGGVDDDLFIYSGGKDVITDYAEGDVISLGAAVSKATVSGSDVIFTIKKNNTLTIKDAKYKEMFLIDKDGNEITTMFGGVIYDDDSLAANTLGASYDVGSAKNRTPAIQITGNARNNTIFGGAGDDTLYGLKGEDSLLGGAGADKLYGGDGDDTLVGGKGNDTLWGDTDSTNIGSDTFIYNKGDGKDTIMYFDEDDVLQINDVSIDDISVKETDTAYVLTINSSNKITLERCSTNIFNINGSYYEVKGKVLVNTKG